MNLREQQLLKEIISADPFIVNSSGSLRILERVPPPPHSKQNVMCIKQLIINYKKHVKISLSSANKSHPSRGRISATE